MQLFACSSVNYNYLFTSYYPFYVFISIPVSSNSSFLNALIILLIKTSPWLSFSCSLALLEFFRVYCHFLIQLLLRLIPFILHILFFLLLLFSSRTPFEIGQRLRLPFRISLSQCKHWRCLFVLPCLMHPDPVSPISVLSLYLPLPALSPPVIQWQK